MYKFTLIIALICAQGNSVLTSPSFANQVIVENVAFNKLGTYRGFTDDGTEYQKSYFFPRYSLTAPWFESRAICNSFGLELVSMESLEEMDAILNLARSSGINFTTQAPFFDIMALTLKSKTDWYWVKSGKKLSFELLWLPGEPNNYNSMNEACLAFKNSGFFGFYDVPCSSSYSFICQRIDFMIPKTL